MEKVASTYKMMIEFFEKHANPKIAQKYSRFFREGYDSYGIDPHLQIETYGQWFAELESKFSLSDFKKLFILLLKSGKSEEIGTVIHFLGKLDRYYSKSLLKQIMIWVKKYFTNWAQVDTLCGSVLSPMILEKAISFADICHWHLSQSKWVRRCVPVTTVCVFQKQKKLPPVIRAAELLINDPVREVGQGVGWMMREAWKVYPKEIELLLQKHIRTGNRTAYQYACEKMDKSYRLKFRRPKH